jgi:5-methylcytosine-specific restriction protein A
MTLFFQAASAEHQKKEKAKARELRQSQWWRQQLGQCICYHCKERFKPEELTMDHLIPIARGGKSNKKNCVPSCKDCNSKKGHKTTAELTLEKMASEKTHSEGFEEREKEGREAMDDDPKNESND